jgi:hypothetical protein
MNLFRKFIGYVTSAKTEEEQNHNKNQSKFMPEEELPTDESFMIKFKENGGKFLYCTDEKEMQETFALILRENSWHQEDVLCFNQDLRNKLAQFNLNFTDQKEATFFISGCEYLIGNTGALLISSNQIKEKKLADLPNNFIIIARTSQLINSIGEGLSGIKNKSKNRIPTNITTIKTFGEDQENDFLNYGSTSKNLYLLLVEDL